jgi:hypothetical protein
MNNLISFIPNFKIKEKSSNINPFPEGKTVYKIYSAINKKDYNELNNLLKKMPNFIDIEKIYSSLSDELEKNDYTMSQLMAISTLLYRLLNIKFVNVELPEQLPNHSENTISNISKRTPNKYKYIDKKIKEIVKNLILHYKLDIKNNSKYNRNNAGNQLALKLKKILFSFIIEYTRPSSEPLSVESNIKTMENQVAHISALRQNQLPRKLEENELMNFYPNL